MPDPIDNQELFSNPIEGLFPEVDEQEVNPEHPEFPEPEPEKAEDVHELRTFAKRDAPCRTRDRGEQRSIVRISGF